MENILKKTCTTKTLLVIVLMLAVLIGEKGAVPTHHRSPAYDELWMDSGANGSLAMIAESLRATSSIGSRGKASTTMLSTNAGQLTTGHSSPTSRYSWGG
jgi:hypothetical protein